MKGTLATFLLLIKVLNSFNAQDIAVPLLDDDLSFRVPVKIFGQTNYFLVDTGTSATALDIRYRDRLGTVIRQWGGHDFYRSPEILMGNTPLGVNEVFCLDLEMFRRISGEPCDGILAMDFLKNQVVSLDFNRGIVSIGKNVRPPMQTNGWCIPMTLSNKRHFRVIAVINERVRLELMLDTADSGTLSLNKSDWDKVFSPGEDAAVHKLLLAAVGNKVTESSMARLRSIQVQSNKYPNVVCLLSMYKTDPSTLGIGFFRRHEVTFDFPNSTLYLRPAKGFDAAEEHDMSGLHLLRQDGDTVVHSVDQASPAAVAGIQASDRLISLNGKSCASLPMKVIRQALRTKPGESVSLEIQRDGETIQAHFALKRLI